MLRIPNSGTVGGQHPTPNRRPWIVTFLWVFLVLSFADLHGATLQPDTLEAWQEYVEAAQHRIDMRVDGSAPFLWAAESDSRLRNLGQGEMIAMPTSPNMPQKAPNGLIHDWIGAAFFRSANLDEVLIIAQDYPRYKEFYKPLVVDSRLVRTDADGRARHFRFSLTMVNNSLFAKHGLDEEWEETYIRVDTTRAYSIARTIAIREIEDYDSPKQHMLPENQGSGYIWRMFAISRFEQRDGGVYVELEALALSRDVPAALRWLADPIIRRISRASLVTSLIETRNAIAAKQARASVAVRPAIDTARRPVASGSRRTSLVPGVQ